MNLNFAVGFPGSKRISKLFLETKNILRVATDDLADKRPRSYKYFDEWFGSFKDDGYGQVRNVLNKMHNAITGDSTINVRYNVHTTCDGVTFAEGLAPNKPESYRDVETANDHDLVICPLFFTLTRFPLRYPAAGVDTQIGTLLHELSHLVGGTDDEKLNNGQDSYGQANCTTLITEDITKCRNNADNYMYFLMRMAYTTYFRNMPLV